ncbi:MAG: hypothetical protein IJ523_08930 [Succinivibrionaceae bacterium]|nr:hypothetical protein [Succinivibrionaceae bacterium]
MNAQAGTLESLLNRIIYLTGEVIKAVDHNRISEAADLVRQRSECIELYSRIKTPDANSLPNYSMFIRSLVRYDEKFNLCA